MSHNKFQKGDLVWVARGEYKGAAAVVTGIDGFGNFEIKLERHPAPLPWTFTYRELDRRDEDG